MNERLKELAVQAGLLWSERDGWWVAYNDSNDLEHFAELVRQDEREACAKLCEAQENKLVKSHPARIEFNPDSMMARKCAAAIRARGEK